VDRIIAQAQGNPFYIEELLNYIHDQNLHLTDPNALSNLELPTSLQSLILSRLDQLPDKQKTTLKVASIVGRIFQASLLWGMYPDLGRPEQVQSDLELISSMQLTAQDLAETDLTYFFKQIVTQQVAYENLPYATRAMLHHHLAQFIEKNSSESLAQVADLLAFHYMRGESWHKAMEFNLMAAQSKQHEYANEAAVAACKNVLEAAAKINDRDVTSEKLAAYDILGDVLTLLGRYEEALHYLQAAKELTEVQPDSPERDKRIAQSHIKFSNIYDRRSEYDKALEVLYTGLALQSRNRASIETALILLGIAGILRRQGKFAEGIEWCQQSIEMAEQITGDEAQQVVAKAYYNLGDLHNRQGNSREAIRYGQQSRDIYERIQDITGLTSANNNLGVVYTDVGEYDDAQQALSKSLELARKIGDVQQIGFLSNNLGNIYLYRGEWEKAVATFKQGNETFRQIGNAYADAVTLGNMAQVYIYHNDLAHAEEALKRYEQLIKNINAVGDLSEVERRWSEFYLRQNDYPSALAHIQSSIDFATAQKDRQEEGKSQRVLGDVLAKLGEYDRAITALQASHAIMTDLNTYEKARTLLVLAEVEIKTSRREAARAHLDEALTIFKSLGAQYFVDKALQLQQTL
jgi:tetratricopeptide (TPR) repeat protein